MCTDCAENDLLLKLPLRTAEEHRPPRVEHEKQPHRLSLVFEPEAAAAWCMELSAMDVKDRSDLTSSLSTKGCFVTVDVGTIDISAHQVNADGRIIVFDLPHGKVYGGTVINNAFITFLEELTMEKIENFCQDSIQHKAEILELKEKTFEEVKLYFADDENETNSFYAVTLPKSYCQRYQAVLRRGRPSMKDGGAFEFVEATNQIRLSKAKMKELAYGSLYQIQECIQTALKSVRVKPDIMYLVGGFGGSSYVAEHIQNVFQEIRVIIPQFHDLAVVRGACLFFKQKPIRTADATYGTVCKLPYNEDNPVHHQAKVVQGKDGTPFCEDLFKPFVHIGEHLDPDYVYETVYSPIREDQETLRLALYSIRERYVDFVCKDGKICEGVKQLGCLFIDLKPLKDVPLNQRHVCLLVDFSSVEITISAYHKSKNAEIKLNTSSDFLSTVDKIIDQCTQY